MPFERVQPEKLSNAVVRQIELLILRGVLRPGERLPAERELAERFGVSRPSLREAIRSLQEAGLLVARANSGIFVAEVLNSAFSPALVALFGAHEEAVFDYIAFRRDMEGLAAARVAQHASDTDLAVVDRVFQSMVAAHAKRNPSDEARLDADFHLAIIEASHNIVMLHMMRAMYELLKGGVFYNRRIMFERRTTREALLDQHRAINDALQNRAPIVARTAIEAHMDYVKTSLTDHLATERNEHVARQRLAHQPPQK